MAYTLNNEINEMKRFMTEQLPDWENATADMLLEVLSKSDNQQIKETAEYIKVSKKSSEMMKLLDFALSMIRNNPTPIMESIYDTATDGIRELNQHRIDKYSTNQNEKNRADATNWLWWLFYRIPGKAELKRRGLMY
ncbi:MAG: hypothetical protein IKX36_12225 [Prevotella sp.]|nr:hypothetical protein [Prevotella sp.]